MPGRNGNGNDHDEAGARDASDATGVLAVLSSSMISLREGIDKQLATLQASLLSSTREAIDEQVELFKQVISLSHDMMRDASANMEKASALLLDHLKRHDGEIKAVKARLHAIEAHQAEAARPEP
jgi:hypothetical protein